MEIYDPVNNALRHVGALLNAAEAHGTLCGLLCAPPADLDTLWLEQILVEEKIKESLVEKCRKQLLLVKAYTLTQLEATDFEFMPLLPDDMTILPERVQALGDWCEGFLLGLGLAGIEIADLPADNKEFVNDVIAISRIAPVEQAREQEEADYLQLVEFIKIGVLTLYEEELVRKRKKGNNG